jgi:hypothetical protein
MKCQHEIEGEDYGECKICGAQFFKTSSGLWQSYDDGSRHTPSVPSQTRVTPNT